MSIYIAGPMTGLPQFNIPAFDAMALQLREVGYKAVSPAELDDPETRAISMASPDGAIATLESHGSTWGDFLSRDVKLIADSDIDAVVVLPGWETSRGARLETFVAHLCGYPIYTVTVGNYWDLRLVPHIDLVRAWGNKADISFHSEVFA